MRYSSLRCASSSALRLIELSHGFIDLHPGNVLFKLGSREKGSKFLSEMTQPESVSDLSDKEQPPHRPLVVPLSVLEPLEVELSDFGNGARITKCFTGTPKVLIFHYSKLERPYTPYEPRLAVYVSSRTDSWSSLCYGSCARYLGGWMHGENGKSISKSSSQLML